MGTGPFAVPTSQRLMEEGHEIPLVVTRPLANPNAKKLPPRPMFDWATENGFPIFEPESINTPDSITRLQKEQADLFFVCDYGQILSNDCLSAAQLGGINLHGSILPRLRGAAPVQWALLRGDKEAGVTVIHMTPRLDAGPAIATSTLRVGEDETAAELEPRLADLGVKTSVDAIAILQNWNGNSQIGETQDKSQVTKAPRFAKSDGQLDFRLSANYLTRLVKACQPWPSTFAELVWPESEGKKEKRLRLLIRGARYCEDLQGSSALGQVPGSVAEVQIEVSKAAAPQYSGWDDCWGTSLAVRCSEGVLLVCKAQPAGKREMEIREFLRGHPLAADCSFQLPTPMKEALCE